MEIFSKALAQIADYNTGSALAATIFGGAMLVVIWVLVMLVALVSLIIWIWALVDCLRREFPGSEKTTWIVVLIVSLVLGLGLIGAIIYLIAGRKKRHCGNGGHLNKTS